MKMSRQQIVAVSITSVLMTSLAVGLPAQATEIPPTVGNCYKLEEGKDFTLTFPKNASPVDCNSPHNIEIFYIGPAQIKTKDDFVKNGGKCPTSTAYEKLGHDLSKPLTRSSGAWMELTRFAWTNQEGNEIICGTGAKWTGKGKSLIEVDAPLSVYSDPAAYSINPAGACLESLKTGRTSVTKKSIKCAAGYESAPLQLTRLIKASNKFGVKYPGDSTFRAWATKACAKGIPAETFWTSGNAAAYNSGSDMVYCWRYAGL